MPLFCAVKLHKGPFSARAAVANSLVKWGGAQGGPMVLHLVVGMAVVAGLTAPTLLRAQGPEMDSTHHAAVMIKLLRYDRALGRHQRPTVTLAVLVDPQTPTSLSCGASMRKALQEASAGRLLAQRPVETVEVRYADAGRLEETLNRLGAAALYVCPARAEVLGALEHTVATHTLTITSRREDFAGGAMGAGLFPTAGGTAVAINLRRARAQGADLEAAVLRVALVTR